MFSKNNRDKALTSRTNSIVKVEECTALTKEEENRLVEIKDKEILSRIDGIIPKTIQIAANTAVVNSFHKAASSGQLFQISFPSGATGTLARSKTMNGAFKGFLNGADGKITSHVDLVPMEKSVGAGLAAVNVVNAVMAVAAMVVGQYYMTQINNQLESISQEIGKIADFQKTEYESRVNAIVGRLKHCATFQVEIMEKDDLRNRELSNLEKVEDECNTLLIQANSMLRKIAASGTKTDYDSYEKKVREANYWYQFQQKLLVIMGMIGDLTYTLNLGAVTKKKCYDMYLDCETEVNKVLSDLADWHNLTAEELGIEKDKLRRKKQGVVGIIMTVPALFNEKYHYKAISNQTAEMINNQIGMYPMMNPYENKDLFQEDVRLIAKEGKLYYLPSL